MKLELNIEQPRRVFHPGAVLRGWWHLKQADAQTIRAVECSVLWHTTGKGDEDFAVHWIERYASSDVWRQGKRDFQCTLPNSPLSYNGVIVKIGWLTRVKVFLKRGKPLTEEVAFWLGAAPGPALSPKNRPRTVSRPGESTQ